MWTPRLQHILTYNPAGGVWARPATFGKHAFKPAVHTEPYRVPPPPPPLKKPPPPPPPSAVSTDLASNATDMRKEAAQLEKKASKNREPNVRMQLGLLLLKEEDGVTKTVKLWDKNGQGLTKAEFRLRMRDAVQATSGEADELFDSWDDDKGGSLDPREALAALGALADETQAWLDASDPDMDRAVMLRRHAQLAEEAAETTAQAEALEVEYEELLTSLETKVSVHLGALLYKRRVNPGAFVNQWSTSRGAHAGEPSTSQSHTRGSNSQCAMRCAPCAAQASALRVLLQASSQRWSSARRCSGWGCRACPRTRSTRSSTSTTRTRAATSTRRRPRR